MPIVRIPLGKAPYYNVDPLSRTAQVSDSVIDGYIDESNTVKRRRGLKPWIDTGAGAGQGAYYWSAQDRLISVNGGRVFSVDRNGTQTELTGVTLATDQVTFSAGSQIDGTPWLYIADGGYPVYTTGVTLTRLTSASGAPANCTSIAWSAGRFLAMDAGTRNFYATDVNPSSGEIENDYFLSADNPLTAEEKPDLLEYIGSTYDDINVWGRESLEVWRADDTFFSPIPGAFAPVGLIAKYSVAAADNTIFGLGVVDGGNKVAVVKLDGRTPKVVSLPIESILNNYDTVEDAIGFVTSDSTYIITFPAEGVTWAYNYRDDKWYQYSRWLSLSATREEFLGRYSVSCWGKTYMQSRTNGQIFEYDLATYTDNGESLVTEYVTGNITHESMNQKRNHYVYLTIKRGLGAYGSPAKVILKWRDNNESAYQLSKQRILDLEEIGQTDCFLKTVNLGFYRSRKYSVVLSDNVELCLVGMDESAEVLSK